MQIRGITLAGIWREWQFPLIVAIIALLLRLWGEPASLLFRYDRAALGEGELWRLFTAHLVHLGWAHLMMNLAGLFVVWAFVARALSRHGWWWLFILCSLAISLAFWWFFPPLEWYVGLSGVLHSMLFGGAVVAFGRGDREGAILALLVILKLIWEQFFGPLPGSESVAGGAVITQAHLYGAVAGGGFVAIVWRVPRWHASLLGEAGR